MKKINFEELMASVSEQIVEEAASFSPIKVFNTRFVALAACIAIIVTAIPAVVILNREKDVDAPKVTTPVEDIVVTPGGEEVGKKNTNVIYVDSNLIDNKELVNLAFENQEVEILNISDYRNYIQGYFNPGRTIKPDINVPAELNVTIGGTSIKATLKSVYYTANNAQVTDEALRANNKIAEYTITSINGESTEGKYESQYNELYYNVTAKEIIRFHTWAVPHESKSKLREEEILEIAKKDVINLYGKDFLEKHTIKIDSSYKAPTVWEEGGYSYRVRFDRVIGGVTVDERVTLAYNGSGKLYQIDSTNLNAFDAVEPKLSKETLNKVEEKAIKLLDGRLIKNKYLEITTDGSVYVNYIYLLREGDDRFSLDSAKSGNICIKINIG